jgi:DNA-binding NarL/FixJ family response regulator
MDRPIRILLAEDQAIIRQGLRYIVDAQPDMRVVGEAGDGDTAIQVALQTKPDLILMDIRMPGRSGIEATSAILASLSETKIVLLTTFDIREYVYDGIRAGAVAYILKDAPTQELLEGIRAAHQGAVIYRSSVSGQVLAQAVHDRQTITPLEGNRLPTLLEPMTERELEVLQQMAYGRQNVEIARLLSVSESTVKTHVHRILQKFGVEDRTQAVVIALRQHIVQ